MLAKPKIILFLAGIGCLVAAGIAFALVYQPSIDIVPPPAPQSFHLALIQKGAMLAAIGDCVVCHTAEGGPPYGGGRPLATPFGTLYATNLTPDKATGIGGWSQAAFKRAMRDGVSRDGTYLYPALPYEHFTHVNDEDINAIYAFLMTRRAVHAEAPANDLIFPLGFRPLLAGWNMLFLHRTPFTPTPGESDEWNRGAYLVEGLGHCGGCHTPRNLAGAEKTGHMFSGGVAEGWNAPPLDASNPVAHTWTREALYSYLHTGIDSSHSVAAGPMGPVARGLSEAPEADVRAIAIYVESLMQKQQQPRQAVTLLDRNAKATREHPAGATLFVGACGGCHGTGAPMMKQGRPALSLVTAIQEDDPRNTLQAVLEGIQSPIGGRGPYMPAFADSLTDGQIAELAAYLRVRYSVRSAWTKLEEAAAEARNEGAQP